MKHHLAVALLWVLSAGAQPPVEFEVASVKAHIRQADGENSETNALRGGRFTARNVTVRKLIRNAFTVGDSRILGAPGWIDSESYDIEAKTAGGVEITRENISQLMQSLLERRFQLRYHRSMSTESGYELEAGKNGLKVREHTGDGEPSMSTNSRSGTVSLKASRLSMKDFAGSLARQLGRPVVDNTGATGEFDFDLTWSPDQTSNDSVPSIFTALQALGLRLVSTKGPVEGIVIDRIERPSEN